MASNREETMRQFCDVTGADENRSRFFLESSNWQLEVALSSFYEHGGNVDEAPVNAEPVPASPQPMSESDMDSAPGSPEKPQKKDKKKKTNTKFATLDSLQQDSSSDEDEVLDTGWLPQVETIVQDFFCRTTSCPKKTKERTSQDVLLNELKKEIERLKGEIETLTTQNDELRKKVSRLRLVADEGAGQAFYAGGSERSGQQILGPGKGRKDIVTEMFKSVRERGAVVFEEEPSSTSRGRGGVFSGAGYRLGQTADDHEQVTPGNTEESDQTRAVRLRLYREGFTVNNGPIRQYTDPENAEFLSCIRRGEIPPELSGGGEVRVSLEDRRHEECPRAISKTQAFTGRGHLLGSPTPATVGATVPVASQPGDRVANQKAAQEAVGLDVTTPVTTVQFRLADGSRLTGRFNHTHTVEDLYQYVSRAEPSYQIQPFALLTTFPSAELADRSVTLASANLLNTTVLQRLK